MKSRVLFFILAIPVGLFLLLVGLIAFTQYTVYSYEVSLIDGYVDNHFTEEIRLTFFVEPTKTYFLNVKEPYDLEMDLTSNKSKYKSIRFITLELVEKDKSTDLFASLKSIASISYDFNNIKIFNESEIALFFNTMTVQFGTEKLERIRFCFNDIGIKYIPKESFDILVKVEVEDSNGNTKITERTFHFVPKIRKIPYFST